VRGNQIRVTAAIAKGLSLALFFYLSSRRRQMSNLTNVVRVMMSDDDLATLERLQEDMCLDSTSAVVRVLVRHAGRNLGRAGAFAGLAEALEAREHHPLGGHPVTPGETRRNLASGRRDR
jgi:1-aminocyclopropane-1-carboxylate deaminase/D-cysteine desulfhydrase-like pyridoxal-dependent ACC family enzyme